MDSMKAAAAAVCAVSAGSAVIEWLFGGTGLKQQLKFILDLILAIVVISPFVSGGMDIHLPQVNTFDLGGYGYSQELYMDALAEQTQQNVSEVLREQIEAAGITCEDIVPEVNISEDMCIDIVRVVLTADDFAAAAGIVRDSLGADTEVVDGAERETETAAWK